MELVPQSIKIGKIMLDPENPRFDSHKSKKTQSQLIEILIDESESGRQLFRSMERDVKWVNRIVVKSVDNLSDKFKMEYGNIDNYDFMVVEGNTRLACLKHKEMTKYTDSTEIPVLVAVKEKGESIENYNKELRLVQGIANVTVVQEWSPISKARHIYHMYQDNLKKMKNPNISTISANISTELGISTDEVKQAIRRFSIYLEVAVLAKAVSPKDWPYFEVFDLNDETRTAFGMITKGPIDFEWNKYSEADNDNYDEDIINKKELFTKIPDIIESAKAENLSSKELRKPFKLFLSENNKSPEDLKNEFIDNILKSDKPRPWENIAAGATKSRKDTEELWKKDIAYFSQVIETYPVMSKWSKKYLRQLTEIRETINNILEILEK